MNNPPSVSSFGSYISTPIKRFFGYVGKTKRSISEEAESGDESSVGVWLREGADPNELDNYGYTPLINASANGRLRAVQNLVKFGADVNMAGPYGYTALHAAAQNGHREIVTFLLESGANINAQNEDQDTPLHLALREQHIEIVNELVKRGGNTRIEGFNKKSSIQCAKECGLKDVAENLRN